MDISWIVIGSAFAAGIVILFLMSAGRRRASKSDRLSHAFERAKYARRTGTMGSDRGYIR